HAQQTDADQSANLNQPAVPERGTTLANVAGRKLRADIYSLAKRLLNATLSCEMSSELHELLMLLENLRYRPASRRAFHPQPRVVARRTATIDLFAAGRALGTGQAAHMFSPQPRTPPSHASLHQSQSCQHIPEHSKTIDAAWLLQMVCWRVAEPARSGQ